MNRFAWHMERLNRWLDVRLLAERTLLGLVIVGALALAWVHGLGS